MRKKSKYQTGGETDFFNQLADSYAAKMNPDYAEQQPDVQYEDDPSQDDTPDYSDYQSLQDKYDDLQGQFTDLSNKFQNIPTQNFNDNFLDFLFSDTDNKKPFDFDSEYKPNTQQNYSADQLESHSNKGFRSFGSYEEGRNALEHQLDLYQTGKTRNPIKPNSSLYEAMSVYAPSSDGNNPRHYAEFIANKLGVSPDTPISQLDKSQWADAIEQMEGNKVGHNPGNLRYQFGGLYDTNKTGYVDSTLNANKNLDWVKRLYNPSYGSIQVPGEKYKSTHLMSDDGQGYVFPEIVNINGRLQYLGNGAENYARQTNTGIQFPQTQGTWFANNGYKKGTGILNSIGNNGTPYNNPHYQNGGMPVARTAEELYTGLNNPKYAQFGQLVMDLPPQYNLIRGLDNGTPVNVQDELGNKTVLKGKNDKKYLYGKLYEHV